MFIMQDIKATLVTVLHLDIFLFNTRSSTYVHTKTCMWMFIAALFITAPKLEAAKMPFSR